MSDRKEKTRRTWRREGEKVASCHGMATGLGGTFLIYSNWAWRFPHVLEPRACASSLTRILYQQLTNYYCEERSLHSTVIDPLQARSWLYLRDRTEPNRQWACWSRPPRPYEAMAEPDKRSHFPPHAERRVWLISSGDSPIGLHLARQLLAHGDCVVSGLVPSDLLRDERRRDYFHDFLAEVESNHEANSWKDRFRPVMLDIRYEESVPIG